VRRFAGQRNEQIITTVCQAGGEYSTAKKIYGRIRQAYIAPGVAFAAGG
jgi:hypothetical protein